MPTFQDDLSFLKSHTEIHLLTDGQGHEVAVSPMLQGRVFTSTLGGEEGLSHGWINRELLASGKTIPISAPMGVRTASGWGLRPGNSPSFSRPERPFDLEHSFSRPL